MYTGARAAILPDFDTRQVVAARRSRGAEQPLARAHRACQAVQFFRRRGEIHFTVNGIADQPHERHSFTVGIPC